MKSSQIGFLAILVMLFVATCMVLAQTSNGTIAGVVTDASGAAVVNATVTATSNQTGATRTTQTNASGAYRIEPVIPGTYTITISAPSFSNTVLNNVTVPGSVVTSANAVMKAGAKETVTVEASTEALQTENGEISHNISTVAVENLPIQNLNPYSLALTLPGVTSVTTADFTNGTSFSVNGLRPRSNNFLIEGQDNNDAGIKGQGLQPENLEAIQEVNVLTNSYSAEFGHGGGSVSNLIFKSGTNYFHGAVWDRILNSSLDASDHGDNLVGSSKSKYRENLFGFAVGGPIKKDKLFFFTSYQWDKFRSTSNGGTLTLPTADGVSTLQSLGPNPRVNNLLQAIGTLRGVTNVSCIPIGNGRPCVNVGQVQRSIGADSDSPEFDAKGDYLINKNDTLSLRYVRTSFTAPFDTFNYPSQLPGFDTTQFGSAHNAGLTYSHVFSPTLVNEFRASYGRIGFTFDFRPETYANPLGTGPTIFVQGLSGWGAPSGDPQGRFHNTYQLQDSLSWTKGGHFLKFGFDFQQTRVRDAVPFNFFGNIDYLGGGGFSGLANFIDDDGGSSNATVGHDFGNPIVRPTLNAQSYYFMDTWKLRPNFTVDFGLRYEYNGTPGNIVQFPALNPANTSCFNCLVKQQADGSNLGPRVSFAYSPRFWKGVFGEEKTVIRAGYGIFYDGLFTNIVDNTASTAPNAVSNLLFSDDVSNPRGTPNWSQVLASLPTTPSPFNSVDSITPHLLSPEVMQWNLNIQRELPGSFTLTTGYIGTRGLHLFGNNQVNAVNPNTGNRLNPNRGSIVLRDNSGDSVYHGLDVQLDRRFSKGLLLRAAYTFAKSMDDTSEVFTTGTWSSYPVVQYPSARKTTDWGLSAFDHRQRFALSYVYTIPKWKTEGVMSALAYVINNWQISGTTELQSGHPLNIEDGFDANFDGIGNDRPSLGNVNAPIASYAFAGGWFGLPDSTLCDGPSGWFTILPCQPVAANSVHWVIPTNGVGNIKRNYLITPGITNWNFGIQRTIKLHEQHAFDFRAEMFNVFNRGNTGTPTTTLVSIPLPGSGTDFFMNYPQTVAGHRRIRFLLKYSF